MSRKQRVKIVNELLKKEGFDLQKVADYFGINYSTFTKLMQEDDYVYIKQENQYYKFVRDESQITHNPSSEDDELTYILRNISLLLSH
jgi:transposase